MVWLMSTHVPEEVFSSGSVSLKELRALAPDLSQNVVPGNYLIKYLLGA